MAMMHREFGHLKQRLHVGNRTAETNGRTGKLYSEKQRFFACTMKPVVRSQIEQAILLKLHPDLCLQPSVEVVQVMNYAHLVQKQGLVRPRYGHRALAKRMKGYQHGTKCAKSVKSHHLKRT